MPLRQLPTDNITAVYKLLINNNQKTTVILTVFHIQLVKVPTEKLYFNQWY